MTSEQKTLLIEIGTEELPPKALRGLSETLGELLANGLKEAGLIKSLEHEVYATPRRLAVKVLSVASAQPDQQVERRGPAVSAAYDADGQPTKAAEGFARSVGVPVDVLERIVTEKGEWLGYNAAVAGKTINELLPQILDQAIKRLPIPKRMRWSDLDTEFVRPVHWLVVLHGTDVIPVDMLSVSAGRETYGHRFHAPGTLSLESAGVYPEVLQQQGKVVSGFDQRKQLIQGELVKLGASASGKVVQDPALVDEVTSLVEWPVPLMGEFPEAYLEVPQEVLISSMQDHQKYFPVVDDAGNLLSRFVTVSNIESKEPSVVIEGNERVLNARLADARFFWDTDRKQTLESRVDRLKDVLFHQKLGTVFEKIQRVQALSELLAAQIGADVEQDGRAAYLAKSDLTTDMVGEFPELQGTMGRYYASHDGEANEVAQAIEEQYLPRFAGDAIPASPVGRCLSIAEKVDSIVGIFSAGETPTGTKDPYALRRQALGVMRIIIEGGLDINLRELLERAGEAFQQVDIEEVFEFMLERLPAVYSGAGIEVDTVNAVLNLWPVSPSDADRRIRAVAAFREMPEAASLAAANKRISNILKKSEQLVDVDISEALLKEPQELALSERISALESELKPVFEAGDYDTALTKLAGLRQPVDDFFDHVMVMDEDMGLRNNRLALLNKMRGLFLRVADISVLQS